MEEARDRALQRLRIELACEISREVSSRSVTEKRSAHVGTVKTLRSCFVPSRHFIVRAIFKQRFTKFTENKKIIER